MKILHLLIVITIISFGIVSVNPSYSLCIGTFQPNIQKDNGMDAEGYHTYLASINDNQTYPIKYKISSGAVIETMSSETQSPTLSIIVREAPQGGNLTIQLPTKLLGLYSAGGYRVSEGARCAAIIGESFPTPIESNLNFTTVEFPLTSHDSGEKMIYITGNYQQPSTTSEFPSPLKQFKSGTSANDVKCNEGLELILKTENNSPTCVKPQTAQKLVERGWASSTFGISFNGARTYVIPNSSASFLPCNTPYLQSDSGMAVLYMPTNSNGKICVRYYNLNNTPTSIGIRIFEENNTTLNASDITTWASSNTLQGNENTTISYSIKTSNKAGFYGLSLFCGGIPFAVGYDANSTLTANDFSGLEGVIMCPSQTYEYKIEGVEGIGIRYIPNSSNLP